jgi:hypothetical protein
MNIRIVTQEDLVRYFSAPDAPTASRLAEATGVAVQSITRPWKGERGRYRCGVEVSARLGRYVLDGHPLPSLIPAPAPAHPAWIVFTPTVGLTCTACDTVAEGITLDSPDGRAFVADHSGHEDPYPATRKGQAAEAEVGA